MRSRLIAGVEARHVRACLLAACTLISTPLVSRQGPAPACRPAGGLALLPDLREASGIAVSRRAPGTLWALNDSGEAVVAALDDRGALRSRVRITGAAVQDWEDLAVGPCPAGSCLYVADIGDNKAARRRVTVYRVDEPRPGDHASAPAQAFHATYPDGPQDAESLIVSADGAIFIVTKGETGPIALYRFPQALRAGATVRLERVGPRQTVGKASDDERITGGNASADGRWVVLRTGTRLSFYPAAELTAGRWRAASHVDLRGLREPQGEGVAMGPDNVVYLVGEGGGGARPGTFARFTCGVQR